MNIILGYSFVKDVKRRRWDEEKPDFRPIPSRCSTVPHRSLLDALKMAWVQVLKIWGCEK
jgi:hypothetical protein